MSVVAIIPALNEGQTIKNVIEVAKSSDLVDRVVVVSDGSTDDTANIARQCDVEVIELKKNIGKGGAMSRGVNSCMEDIIIFLDADLIGLNKNHVNDLIKPVLDGSADMSLGVFVSGRVRTDLAQIVTPFLSGQRAIRRDLFNNITDVDVSRYGVEMALTKYVKKNNIPYVKVKLRNLTHITKEEKLGLGKGLSSRFKMYWDIIKSLKIFDKLE